MSGKRMLTSGAKAARPEVVTPEEKAGLLALQEDEATAERVYSRLAKIAAGKNRETLLQIAGDERRHYKTWKSYTGKDVMPSKFELVKHTLLAKVLGLTFTIKALEREELQAQKAYRAFSQKFPELAGIIADEHRHEKVLIGMIREEKLEYIGSMVLGLNDALVELLGTLAGLTLAFGKTRLVGISGLITGIAAGLSMMSSEYLSKKSDKGSRGKSPRKAAMYTGIAYFMTVFLLVMPFFLFSAIFFSLGVSVLFAILIILFFTYYSSVVYDERFGRKFGEMAAITLGVAAISFVIGLVIKNVLNIPI